jgi:hypothetical protein
MNSLEQALTIPDLPEISQTILNLAEFMEHCDKGPLPLDPVLLGEQAVKCRAYAKALHYKVSILLSSNFAKWDIFSDIREQKSDEKISENKKKHLFFSFAQAKIESMVTV